MANSKKDVYLDVAEQMFVFQNMTREEIAKRLKLSDKTVREWAKEHGWEEKKKQLLECKRATHQELYELVRMLTSGLRQDQADGKEISWQRISALKGLIDSLNITKKYEDAVTTEKDAKEQKADSPEALTAQVHEILGLT